MDILYTFNNYYIYMIICRCRPCIASCTRALKDFKLNEDKKEASKNQRDT